MAAFAEFEPYKLNGVRLTDRELGHGSYATVLELEYLGLKCAGKKIHELLLRQGDTSYTVRRFEEECRLLSQVRHPNIVQFLGVYFQQGMHVPILVMEFLPNNLTSCIEQYGIFPKEIGYSILHDVALGLCYLHNQIPTIIHRDLSSNNVLLTSDMTAKISDLGVARIVNLPPLQVSRMTQNPGTAAYMPPEVMIADPKYDTSMDVFSYGIMMIHLFSGRWPEPQVGQVRTEPGDKMIPVSEAERRDVFLQAIGNDHPLMDLILLCIKNEPKCRPHITEIVQQMRAMTSEVYFAFPNKVEMVRRSQVQERHNQERALMMTETDHRQESGLERESRLREEVERLDLVHSRLQISDLTAQNRLLVAKNDAKLVELNTTIEILERDRHELEVQKEKESESKERLAGEIRDLQSKLSHSETNVSSLERTNSKLEASISRQDATIVRKGAEFDAHVRVLKEKDTIISGMNEELTKTREYLTTKQQAIQASITWKQCPELPTKLSEAKTTVIDGKVYCGGGVTEVIGDARIVYCYDPLQDKWSALPPLPVRFFGLGRINGALVAVGGTKMGVKGMYKDITNEVYTYNEQLQTWEQTIPHMPTARHSPGVLSLESALIVASGFTSGQQFANTVEIFQQSTSQWYRTDPLLIDCCDVSMTANSDRCYVLGGSKERLCLNQVLYATVNDLLRNAVPVDQTTHTGSSDHDTQTAWKLLPNTPIYRPASCMLADHLLAIGGSETPEGGADKKEVYVYSPSTNCWIYISNMPVSLCEISVNALSPVEILVTGGRMSGRRMNTVYRGILNLKL